MEMHVVIRYAKRHDDGRELTRDVHCKLGRTRENFNWYEAIAAAMFYMQRGERIVRISEAGYHD